ncbi:MAG: Arc family DNA binding domain-containing protein [bacterium]
MPKRKAYLLRIPPDLWEEISRWAADDLRSVNGHIEWVLREAVRRRRAPGRRDDPPPASREE